MEFRIASTFTDSLARLAGQEHRAVKTTAFDLQVNPAPPGLQFHRIERAKDPSFWSVRVSRDIRLVAHRTEQSILLCYVDHHDKAYAWAQRRRIERHPRTGAAQLVEIRERVEEIPVYVEAPAALAVETKPPLFAHQRDDVLLSYGVPEDWLGAVRQVDEDGLFELAEHLPQEAAEALLDLAVGVTPKVVEVWPRMRMPLRIPMRSGVSGSWRTSRSCARRWSIPGSVGPSSCTRPAGAGGAPLRRPGAGGGLCRHRQDRGRPAPGGRTWHGAIRRRACW